MIKKRGLQYIPILSPEAFTNMDFIARIGSATGKDGLILPCWAVSMEDLTSSSKILQIEPAKFDLGWKSGLEKVLKSLQSKGVKPQFDLDQGYKIALQAYMPEPVTKAANEKVFANVFSVTIPKSILVYELNGQLTDNELSTARQSWAFSKVKRNMLVAFEEAPASLPVKEFELSREFVWDAYEEVAGRRTLNVIKELVRRSLDVACFQAGLLFCEDRKVLYFPEKEGDRHNVSFTHVDGRKTHVTMTGTKQDGWGDRAVKFRYQLGPKFSVGQDEEGFFWITTRIYVRVTDMSGKPYQDKDIARKRKKITKAWWNKEWLARILGLMQGLSNSESANSIEIGCGKRKVTVSTTPLYWDCPVSIDVEAVDRIGDFQEEMAAMRFREDEEDEDDEEVEIKKNVDDE